ncbi:MAG TPA: hypothetical protein VGF23_13350 [Gaiellaceae bacterium]|jgi:hypothetical protein
MSSIRTAAVAAALAAGATAVAVPVASAKDGDGIRVRGACTAASESKLKLSREDGRVEVEFEVDQNRNGVPWKVTLRRNGRLVASTTATTRAPSGSFTVRRVVAGGRIAAVATRTSERCSAQASF